MRRATSMTSASSSSLKGWVTPNSTTALGGGLGHLQPGGRITVERGLGAGAG